MGILWLKRYRDLVATLLTSSTAVVVARQQLFCGSKHGVGMSSIFTREIQVRSPMLSCLQDHPIKFPLFQSPAFEYAKLCHQFPVSRLSLTA